MDDATSRAREMTARQLSHGLVMRPDYAKADQVLAGLKIAGLALYDTRTHVAVLREPSEEVVERVAWAIQQAAEQNGAPPWDMLPAIFKHAQEHRREEARAAIAALVAEQTQGGEPDAPP